MSSDLTPLLNPATVAVVGASSKEGKAGHSLVWNLARLGFKGRVYPVNPGEKEILGYRCYQSINDIPDPLDLVLIAVPAPHVLEVIKECVSKKVKYGVIITAGFKEATEEGGKTQDEIVRLARGGGMRLIGPNCLGFANAHDGVIAIATPFQSWRSGGIAYISQSGVLAGAFAKWILDTQDFGIGVTISLGNKCDLDEADIVEGYLQSDPRTTVICLYSETIREGARFVKVMKEAARHKPVVMVKSGRTDAGASAAFSHTGSLASDNAVTDAALKQAGIIRVDTFQDLIDYGKVFDYSSLPRGNRVGIVTLSGASAVLAVDQLSQAGLELARCDDETRKKVEKEIMPPWQPAKNPLDVWISLGAGSDKVHRVAIGSMLECKQVDCVLAILIALPPSYFDVKGVFSALKELARSKPLVISILGDAKADEWARTLDEMRIPAFTGPGSIERAAKSLAALYYYSSYRKRLVSP